jgi:predicted RNase H-like HicB family nuclease
MNSEIKATHRAVAEDRKKLEYYLGLRYPIEIVEEEDGVVATIPDLPGCASFGETIDEAVGNVNSTKELWISGRIESGQSVPEPNSVDEFSGKFVLRIPRVLHKSLDREAKRQGVSLNQYILHLLSERNALTILQVGVQQTIPSLTMFADPHALWPEERPVCRYSFSLHSGPHNAGRSLLSHLDYVHKLPKDFKKVITPMAAYES